jgi:hypothetical protein
MYTDLLSYYSFIYSGNRCVFTILFVSITTHLPRDRHEDEHSHGVITQTENLGSTVSANVASYGRSIMNRTNHIQGQNTYTYT